MKRSSFTSDCRINSFPIRSLSGRRAPWRCLRLLISSKSFLHNYFRLGSIFQRVINTEGVDVLVKLKSFVKFLSSVSPPSSQQIGWQRYERAIHWAISLAPSHLMTEVRPNCRSFFSAFRWCFYRFPAATLLPGPRHNDLERNWNFIECDKRARSSLGAAVASSCLKTIPTARWLRSLRKWREKLSRQLRTRNRITHSIRFTLSRSASAITLPRPRASRHKFVAALNVFCKRFFMILRLFFNTQSAVSCSQVPRRPALWLQIQIGDANTRGASP